MRDTMKLRLVVLDNVPQGDPQLCPSCGALMVINHEKSTIHHIHPMCEWFEVRANMANALIEKHRKVLN